VEVRGPDGTYQLYYRTETETIQESPTLTRCITRTYNPNLDRNEHLTQIVEAGTRAQMAGSRTVTTISSPEAARDTVGRVERSGCSIPVLQRELEGLALVM
jgi:hypothetical protein